MLPSNKAKIILDALIILGQTGGVITSSPDRQRRWKVRNDECSCNSTSLVRACKAFVEDFKAREDGRLL